MTQLATKGRQAGLPATLIGTQTPFARRRVESFLAAKLNFGCDRYLGRRFRNFLLEKRIVVSPWLDCTMPIRLTPKTTIGSVMPYDLAFGLSYDAAGNAADV